MAYLKPSLDCARSWRDGMQDSLWDSVRIALAERDVTLPAGESAEGIVPKRTGPLDFGAYFDLVLTPPDLEALPLAIKEEAAVYLAARLAGIVDHPVATAQQRLVFSNLSEPAYSPGHAARLSRWWDIEPMNSMALTGLSSQQFLSTRQLAQEALAKLSHGSPELHAEMEVLIGDIILARPDGTQRFDYSGASSFALWGALTVNVLEHRSWAEYLSTIVHEAAHNLLFAIAREQPLVTDAPDERRPSPLREDLRPIDGIFHAAFVSARESMAFDAMLCSHEEQPYLSPQEVNEFTDMLESSATAFWDCIAQLRADAHFTPLGADILAECEAYMKANFLVEPA